MPLFPLDSQRYRTDSALLGSRGATVGGAARSTDTVTGAVGLVTEQVDVQQIETDAAPTLAAIAAISTEAAVGTVAAVAAIAAPAAVASAMTTTMTTAATATGVEQGQDGTGGK